MRSSFARGAALGGRAAGGRETLQFARTMSRMPSNLRGFSAMEALWGASHRAISPFTATGCVKSRAGEGSAAEILALGGERKLHCVLDSAPKPG